MINNSEPGGKHQLTRTSLCEAAEKVRKDDSGLYKFQNQGHLMTFHPVCHSALAHRLLSALADESGCAKLPVAPSKTQGIFFHVHQALLFDSCTAFSTI
jgi:hypothetical protein